MKNTISVLLVLKIPVYFVPCVETAFTSNSAPSYFLTKVRPEGAK